MPSPDPIPSSPPIDLTSPKAAQRDVARSWKLARAMQLLERYQWAGPGATCVQCGAPKHRIGAANETEEATDERRRTKRPEHAKGCDLDAFLTDRVWHY